MTDHIKFEDIGWVNRGMRGKGFGVRGKTYCYFDGREPRVFEMTTGSKPERLIRLAIDIKNDAFRNPFGPQLVTKVFSESLGATEGLDFNNLFLSESGKDEWPAMGFTKDPIYRDPATCALKPNTTYYFMVGEIPTGHDSMDPKDYGFRLSYASTSQDDLDDFASRIVVARRFPIDGVMGTWTPDSA